MIVIRFCVHDWFKVVAVKQLKILGTKPKEFTEHVIKLSDLQHPNLAELIGYCAEDEYRILVFEYMPMGSIIDNLHGNYDSLLTCCVLVIVFCYV